MPPFVFRRANFDMNITCIDSLLILLTSSSSVLPEPPLPNDVGVWINSYRPFFFCVLSACLRSVEPFYCQLPFCPDWNFPLLPTSVRGFFLCCFPPLLGPIRCFFFSIFWCMILWSARRAAGLSSWRGRPLFLNGLRISFLPLTTHSCTPPYLPYNVFPFPPHQPGQVRKR